MSSVTESAKIEFTIRKSTEVFIEPYGHSFLVNTDDRVEIEYSLLENQRVYVEMTEEGLFLSCLGPIISVNDSVKIDFSQPSVTPRRS